jgi:TRAP-type mannitol/chloroaromatic compound transport system permease large subunit
MATVEHPKAARGSIWTWLVPLVLLAAGGLVAMYVSGLSADARQNLLYHAQDALPIIMFLTLAVLLFSGYPVAFILGGIALTFGLLGMLLGTFKAEQFFAFVPRIWGQAAENLVLVSIPTFIFMGVIMERSGIANDLLYCVQVLLKKVPGALALGVTIMGTILAAMTGIIGASVTMMTALALPTMMRQGYAHWLGCGTIAAAGTLGILIPPSIMLIIMADLLGISVGNLFMAALVPGLSLSALYLLFILLVSWFIPRVAPPLDPKLLAVPRDQLWTGVNPKALVVGAILLGWIGASFAGLVPATAQTPVAVILGLATLAMMAGPLLRSAFVPPVFLIGLIKSSILFGFATPSEAGAVGAFGAMLLALFAGRLTWPMLHESTQLAAKTIAMVFFIIVSATCFAFVYRALGGDDIVEKIIREAGLSSWGFLFLIMAIVFALGFFLDWIEITLIVLPVFAPMIASLDFGAHVAKADMVYWFAILMAVNLQTSFLTPPFGFALFYLKGIAPKEVKIQSIYLGIIPFVILQLIGLILVITYPDVALWMMRTTYGS